MSSEKTGKVLYITNTIAEYRLCFLQKLSSQIDVVFLITHPEMASKIYGSDGSENTLNVINLKGSLLKNICAIKKHILSFHYDKIILPPADSVREILEGYTSLHYAKKTGADIFTWTEKWEPEKKYQPFSKKMKNLVQRVAYGYYAKNATRCIAFGAKSKEYINSVGADSAKIRIAHMTSVPPYEKDLFPIRKKHLIENNKKIIFCLARMIPRKGIEVIIDAMVELNKRHNDCVLLLGGDGPLKDQLNEKVKKQNMNNIIFTGRIPPEERSTYYAQSDVFVLPSRIVGGIIEGWGLPVNEALFCGTPVIATTAVGSAYDMLNGKNGIMVEQNNALKLSEAIETILFYSDRKEVGAEIEKVNAVYSIETMTNGFVDALMF